MNVDNGRHREDGYGSTEGAKADGLQQHVEQAKREHNKVETNASASGNQI